MKRQRSQLHRRLGEALEEALRALIGLDGGVLRARRREKFLEIGKRGLA